MEENQYYNNVKKRGVKSVLSLFFQSGYSAVLGLVANLVVTILLSPTIFGMYITVLSIISVLNYFSDIGLAASLIQKKEATFKDFKSTFTVQQILVVCIVFIGFAATNFVVSFYKLPKEGLYLYWALLAGFFLSSLKTIPSILLERKIQFQKIVLVQVTENTIFYITVIICAVFKMGLTSFTCAVLLRAISGLIFIYILSPWKPTLGLSKESLTSLLKFGIPFQASSFLALFKDDLITLFLGKVVGFEGVGYIFWAKKWAESPIRIIMDNITKVLFPVISRLQGSADRVKHLVERILFFQTAILSPVMLAMALLMEYVIVLIPKYAKWQPALPLLYMFCASAFLASFSSPLLNLTNALGKVKISFFFMIVWTVATWILTPVLTHTISFYGFPLTVLLISLSSVVVIKITQNFIPFLFIKSVYKPTIAAFCMGLGILAIKSIGFDPLISFLLCTTMSPVIYIVSLSLFFKIDIIKEVWLLFTS